mmetsp:Transcript_44745/g.106205  ORF Transcript_44745/g.106205 Transcript_44745/m.106205 type:complete len:679 (-) Transcript_44745:98-2134(-)
MGRQLTRLYAASPNPRGNGRKPESHSGKPALKSMPGSPSISQFAAACAWGNPSMANGWSTVTVLSRPGTQKGIPSGQQQLVVDRASTSGGDAPVDTRPWFSTLLPAADAAAAPPAHSKPAAGSRFRRWYAPPEPVPAESLDVRRRPSAVVRQELMASARPRSVTPSGDASAAPTERQAQHAAVPVEEKAHHTRNSSQSANLLNATDLQGLRLRTKQIRYRTYELLQRAEDYERYDPSQGSPPPKRGVVLTCLGAGAAELEAELGPAMLTPRSCRNGNLSTRCMTAPGQSRVEASQVAAIKESDHVAEPVRLPDPEHSGSGANDANLHGALRQSILRHATGELPAEEKASSSPRRGTNTAPAATSRSSTRAVTQTGVRFEQSGHTQNKAAGESPDEVPSRRSWSASSASSSGSETWSNSSSCSSSSASATSMRSSHTSNATRKSAQSNGTRKSLMQPKKSVSVAAPPDNPASRKTVRAGTLPALRVSGRSRSRRGTGFAAASPSSSPAAAPGAIVTSSDGAPARRTEKKLFEVSRRFVVNSKQVLIIITIFLDRHTKALRVVATQMLSRQTLEYNVPDDHVESLFKHCRQVKPREGVADPERAACEALAELLEVTNNPANGSLMLHVPNFDPYRQEDRPDPKADLLSPFKGLWRSMTTATDPRSPSKSSKDGGSFRSRS